MRRLILAAMMLIGGCTTPDDPNYRIVRSGIAHMPVSAQEEARRWAAQEKAWRYFSDEDPSQTLMTVTCTDASGRVTRHPVLVEMMVECLGAYMAEITERGLRKALTFQDCVDTIVNGYRYSRYSADGTRTCTHEYHSAFQEDVQDPDWLPENQDTSDVSRELVSVDEIPAWVPFAIIGGVVVLLVAPEFAPALCLLGNDAACPANPTLPPGQRPQPPDVDR